MGRRLVTALAALAVAVAAGGCAGLTSGDAAEATRLLERAQAAQAELESMTFRMRVTGEVEGQEFTMTADGGAYLQGERAGDLVLEAIVGGPGVPPIEYGMVVSGGRAFANLGTGWQEFPGFEGVVGPDPTVESNLAGFDITPYVTDVSVERETTFLGEPVTKIAGTIDTTRLFDSLVGQLSTAGPLGGNALASGLPDDLGETRVALYVSEVTHLLRALHVELTVEEQGQTMRMAFDYSLQSANEPVAIPAVAA